MVNISVTGIRKDDKSVVEFNMYISHPYWITEGEEAACDVQISPLDENPIPIHGIDPLQALQLATEFSYILMSATSDDYDLTYHTKVTHM